MKLKKYSNIHYMYAFILIMLIWHITSMILNTSPLPSPLRVMENIFKGFEDEMSIHVFFSLKRICIAIGLSLIAAVPVGILMGYFKKIDLLLAPIVYFAYPIPKLALLPIIMILFGLGDTTKIAMISLITFFPMVVNIRDEVKNIPSEIYYPMYSIGAKDMLIIKEVVFPASLNAMFTSLRVGLGTSISVLFFTENFGTEYGMGYYIMDSWMRIDYVRMYSGIIILSIIGMGLFVFIDFMQGSLCPWLKDV